MPEITYYFDGHSASDWVNPNNFNDGDTGTFATDLTNGHIHTFNSNTNIGTDLGAITKVEVRVHGYGDGGDEIYLTPVFTGGDGDTHITVPASSPAWGTYQDITNDTNAPDWSSWSHIQSLGLKAEYDPTGKANTMYGSKVEIRVTYWAPPESDIDVGADPIDRSAYISTDGWTIVTLDNPANAGGTITAIKVYANANITAFRVGTFYLISGTTYKCRDSVLIGDVTAGAEQTFTGLSITVATGDYIGCYSTGGSIENSDTGFANILRVSGEYIDPNDETSYSALSGFAISLYGYGDISGAAWKQLQYTSEPPTSNAWNQLKHTSAGGWNQIKFEGE